ncbi:histidine kinase [Flavobacterium arcticum]|uniref:Histidine kinase n=1 Tax=Flavobacterium arcticum TaxID=1784713 RepID=A0A345HEI1_9FLAO|nr:2TM domain-containing protein [Flavobacterium arcticum]AXG74991.1 histidine kinase [Flavobacterium arcticum]KAF2506544.1 2TM domain-containing protein [Flavobacterium arcticum]
MERSLEEQMRYDRAKKRVKAIKGFFIHLTAYVLVNTFLLTLNWVDLKPGEDFFTFRTFNTAFFWGFGLMFHAFGVFGSQIFLGNNWEERKIKEMMSHEDRESKKWE